MLHLELVRVIQAEREASLAARRRWLPALRRPHVDRAHAERLEVDREPAEPRPLRRISPSPSR